MYEGKTADNGIKKHSFLFVKFKLIKKVGEEKLINLNKLKQKKKSHELSFENCSLKLLYSLCTKIILTF